MPESSTWKIRMNLPSNEKEEEDTFDSNDFTIRE
jgi:hypothetical protein